MRYAPEKSAIIWSIKQFPGGKEFLMRAHFGLPTVRKGARRAERVLAAAPHAHTRGRVRTRCLRVLPEEADKKKPISVKFEIPYYTTSGIQVRYLKIIEKSGYQALPWVRYITQNGGTASACALGTPAQSFSLCSLRDLCQGAGAVGACRLRDAHGRPRHRNKADDELGLPVDCRRRPIAPNFVNKPFFACPGSEHS